MRGLARPWIGLTAIVAGASALLAVGTLRVHEWVVMTDELLYAKLARHIGTTGSILPVLHGTRVGFLGIVYPVLLSPFAAGLDTVAAFRAAHVLNAVLFASAAIPAYLLARRLVTPGWGLAVALLTVTVPWAANAAFVMSEPAAYPVFLWAVLASHVALSEPEPRADALAALAIGLAFVTRPQFLFLVAVVPVAAVVTAGPRKALAEHRVLAAVYAAGAVVVVVLAALGQAHTLLGDYGVTATEGSILPAIAFKSAALHLDVLAVGLGVLPFLLGAGWTYSSPLRGPVRHRAFAALTGLALPALALETGSYDVRFGGPDVIRDRYVFYLAPLLLLASAAGLAGERLPLAGIAAATVFFAATAVFADFTPTAGLWVDSPESVLNGVIHDESGGLPAGVFVALCGAVLGVIALALVFVPRPVAAAGAAVAVFSFSGALTGYAFERLLDSTTPQGIPVTGSPRVRDWVDRSIPSSRHAGLIAYPISRRWDQSAIVWWDTEFWNAGIDRAFVVPDRTFTYTPFPSTVLGVDFSSGRFDGTDDAPVFVVAAQNDSRFQLAGSQTGTNQGLVIRAVDRPYRAVWASRGLDPDGWARPRRPATIRVYADPGSGDRPVRVTVLLDSPPEAAAPVGFTLGEARGTIAPGTRTEPAQTICVPGGGHADLRLTTGASATIDGPPLGPTPSPARVVGVAVSGVDVTPQDGAC